MSNKNDQQPSLRPAQPQMQEKARFGAMVVGAELPGRSLRETGFKFPVLTAVGSGQERPPGKKSFSRGPHWSQPPYGLMASSLSPMECDRKTTWDRKADGHGGDNFGGYGRGGYDCVNIGGGGGGGGAGNKQTNETQNNKQEEQKSSDVDDDDIENLIEADYGLEDSSEQQNDMQRLLNMPYPAPEEAKLDLNAHVSLAPQSEDESSPQSILSQYDSVFFPFGSDDEKHLGPLAYDMNLTKPPFKYTVSSRAAQLINTKNQETGWAATQTNNQRVTTNAQPQNKTQGVQVNQPQQQEIPKQVESEQIDTGKPSLKRKFPFTPTKVQEKRMKIVEPDQDKKARVPMSSSSDSDTSHIRLLKQQYDHAESKFFNMRSPPRAKNQAVDFQDKESDFQLSPEIRVTDLVLPQPQDKGRPEQIPVQAQIQIPMISEPRTAQNQSTLQTAQAQQQHWAENMEEEKDPYIHMQKAVMVQKLKAIDEQLDTLKHHIADLEQKASREIVQLSNQNTDPSTKDAARIYKLQDQIKQNMKAKVQEAQKVMRELFTQQALIQETFDDILQTHLREKQLRLQQNDEVLSDDDIHSPVQAKEAIQQSILPFLKPKNVTLENEAIGSSSHSESSSDSESEPESSVRSSDFDEPLDQQEQEMFDINKQMKQLKIKEDRSPLVKVTIKQAQLHPKNAPQPENEAEVNRLKGMMKAYINNPQKTRVQVSQKNQMAYLHKMFELASIRGDNQRIPSLQELMADMMNNAELGIRQLLDGSVQYPVRDTFCDGISIVRNPDWIKQDYFDLFESEGLVLIKPVPFTSENQNSVLRLLKTKYFCKLKDSGGPYNSELARKFKRIALALFNSYPAYMINNQDLTDEQYFGVRLKAPGYLSLGISKIDMDKDFAGFLYINQIYIQQIIEEIRLGLGVNYGSPMQAKNSSELMLQVLFRDSQNNPLIVLTIYNKGVRQLEKSKIGTRSSTGYKGYFSNQNDRVQSEVFLRTWQTGVMRFEVSFLPRNHQTFLNSIDGPNSYQRQFEMIVKVAYKVIAKYQCLYIVPGQLVIDQFFNAKKNPRPAIAVRIDQTIGVCFFVNRKSNTFHAIVNQNVPEDLSFEMVCQDYLPSGKMNLIYDSRRIRAMLPDDQVEIDLRQGDIQEYYLSCKPYQMQLPMSHRFLNPMLQPNPLFTLPACVTVIFKADPTVPRQPSQQVFYYTAATDTKQAKLESWIVCPYCHRPLIMERYNQPSHHSCIPVRVDKVSRSISWLCKVCGIAVVNSKFVQHMKRDQRHKAFLKANTLNYPVDAELDDELAVKEQRLIEIKRKQLAIANAEKQLEKDKIETENEFLNSRLDFEKAKEKKLKLEKSLNLRTSLDYTGKAADQFARTQLVEESKETPKPQQKAPKNQRLVIQNLVQNVAGIAKIQQPMIKPVPPQHFYNEQPMTKKQPAPAKKADPRPQYVIDESMLFKPRPRETQKPEKKKPAKKEPSYERSAFESESD